MISNTHTHAHIDKHIYVCIYKTSTYTGLMRQADVREKI